jgi:hypothetical protein
MRAEWNAEVEEAVKEKQFAPISQDFRLVQNEAIHRKESGAIQAHRDKYSKSDKSLPTPLIETLWDLRYRIGLILAVCAIVAGIIATFQFGMTSDTKLVAPAHSADELVGPDEIVEQIQASGISRASWNWPNTRRNSNSTSNPHPPFSIRWAWPMQLHGDLKKQ